MKLQIDVPDKLSRKLTILKGVLNLPNKQDVILNLIDKYNIDAIDESLEGPSKDINNG